MRVAIIMDGNARWAEARGLPVLEGHRVGAKALKQTVRNAVKLDVKELTVYAFSTENWTRPRDEVEGLMAMFAELIESETPELDEEGVRMVFIGRRDEVSDQLREKMAWSEGVTRANDRMTLFVAFNYGGGAGGPRRRARGDPRRGRALRRRDGGGLREAPVRARDDRPRPPDPHERRAAAVQLPPVAVRVLGARVLRRAVARLRDGRPVRGARRVRGAAAALRGAVGVERPGNRRGAA